MIRSPSVGHVIVKNVEEGDRIEPGTTLFEIADLSQVWVEADVFERDIPLLKTGQTVEITAEALPNQTITGTIILVHPHLETATRTNRIRVQLPNPGHLLRPGMYATVRINVPFAGLDPYKSEFVAKPQPPKQSNDKVLIAFQKTCPVTGNELGSMGEPVKRQVGNRVVFLCCPACIEKFDASKDKYLAQLSRQETAPPAGKVLVVPESAGDRHRLEENRLHRERAGRIRRNQRGTRARVGGFLSRRQRIARAAIGWPPRERFS